jgi:large subunit ribosomal protein L7/L12
METEMATMTNDDIIDAIGQKTVIELSELIDAFKDKFNVEIAAPAAAAPAAGAAGEDAAAVEEQTEFTVMLTAAGEKKIQVIKAVREITGLGLKEAKAVVDEVPSPVREDVPKAEAEELMKKLIEQGASVELK